MSAVFSCREAVHLANQALEVPLSWRKRWELRVHLAMCQACRRYRRQMSALDRLIRGRAPDETPDVVLTPGARARISRALRGEPPQTGL